MRSSLLVLGVSVIALGVAVACATNESGKAPAPVAAASPVAAKQAASLTPLAGPSQTMAYRRLTESQYRHAVADIFGSAIVVNARFEPEQRQDGLLAIGNAQLSVTTTGFEQYVALARSISDQVMDPKVRDAALNCKPSGAADSACAEQFIKAKGEQLFRRPLTKDEVATRLALWKEAAGQSNDFYKGLKYALVSLLVSPEFLFRAENLEADPTRAGESRLTGYAKAQRLAFMLWDTTPDAELLAAAKTGELHTQDGLQKQVDRMIASPRYADGVRAFLTDMLRFDAFENLTKDPATYPLFSQAVADSAKEETLKSMVDLLVDRNGDYRDIFTTRETIINRPLAAVYNVPFISKEKWAHVTMPADSERSGVLTQVTFLALFSHPGSSSPTIRGVNLNDIFLCMPTPPPPPNVDFSKVQATANGTVRTRLIDHMTNPGCSSCHRISDPVGLTLEHFDGMGQHRVLENGQPIDVSGEIGGKKFVGAQGLGGYLHDAPGAPACVTRNVYYYGQGRAVDYKEAEYLKGQTDAFAKSGYKIRTLYRSIILSPEFFKVVKPPTPKPAAQTAASVSNASGDGR